MPKFIPVLTPAERAARKRKDNPWKRNLKLSKKAPKFKKPPTPVKEKL